MNTSRPTRLVICLLTFPASAILAVVVLLIRGFVSLPGENLGEWAEVVSSGSYLVSQCGYVIAYVAPFFGFWALSTYLSEAGNERLAFWGLMGALVGTALPLTTLGIFTYASPALGRLYLLGDTHLPAVITEIAMGPSMVLGTAGAAIYVLGCVLLAVGIWKSGALPRVPAIMIALHGVLIAFGFGSPAALVASWVLLGVAGTWLALRVARPSQ